MASFCILLVHTALDLCWERFEQAGINILSNSFDAIHDLKEKWVRIEVGQQMIEIIDSGKGIDKANADKIMQPFFTTKSVGKGTGLGLSISRGIIQNHGGDLICDSSNSNTCFIIRFGGMGA